MKRITILIADDCNNLRQEFRKLLEAEVDLEVIGEAKDGRQAVALAKELLPALILMDIAMPRLDGLQATRQILRAAPACKVLILSVHSEEEYVDEAFSSGAMGYLVKHLATGNVCHAIREVQKGKMYYSQPIPSGHHHAGWQSSRAAK